MARIFTAGDIITKARRQANMEGASGLKFVTAAEALRLTSQAWTWLHGLLVKADADYFEETQSIITTDTGTYPLPDDYFETKRIDYAFSTTDYRPLKKITSREINAYQTSNSTAAQAEAYRLVGGNVVLYPTPPTGQTYRHLYIPAPADLTATTDEIDGRAGWEELIVLKVVIRMKLKAEDDVTALQAELDAEVKRVVMHADERNPFEGGVIADVESFDDCGMMRPYRYAGTGD